MTEPAKVAELVLSIFKELPNRPIRGSNLGLQIRTRFPEFNPDAYSCRNLRHFLQMHVPQIVEAGRSGQDVEYSLKPANPVAQALTASTYVEPLNPDTATVAPVSPIRHDLWKTFVTPNSDYQMYVHPDEHSFQILRRRESAPPIPWVKVPPCPAETHVSIAKEFLQQVSNAAHRSELESVLASRIWWIDFLRISRTRGLDKDWINFRRKRLAQEFASTLSSLSVPVSAAAGRSSAAILRTRATKPTTIITLPDGELRNALQRVVGRLSNEELRRIWLPVGPVIDEVQGN